MEKQSQAEAVAELSGYLYGISAFNGELRQYENSSYILERGVENHSIGMLINGYFSGQYEFSFETPVILEGGLGELEKCMQTILIRDFVCIKEGRILGLQHLLSFRIMDMIQDIFGDDYSQLKVIKLREKLAPPSAECVFYCVFSKSLLLVLQFNDYREIRS